MVSALAIAESVNPYQSDLPEGTILRAVDAVDWSVGQRNCDIRPRLLDKSTGTNRLVDSGSQITVTRKKPSDILDPSFKLVAVNGTKIPTYGIREISVKIGRKAYSMPAIVCDIQQDILGMDFLTKYRLNFEWDGFDQSELYLVDRKADIKDLLQIVTVPTDTLRVSYLDSSSQSRAPPPPEQGRQAGAAEADPEWALNVPKADYDTIAFEVACMKKLDATVNKKKSIQEQLKLHSEEYQNLIKAYPKLLEPSFSKGEPTHGVYHRIETQGPPCKTKRRPIVMDSAKAAAGKAAWDQMIRDGVVEKVKAGTNTDYSSALHLAPKPGGGARPCTDFRALNSQTIVDAHPLPLLKDFTSKIYGSKVFSVVDLRSAFFNVPIWPAHRHKTLTLSPWGGSYIYNRLAFGLASGPSTWQKLLEHTLRDISNIFIYLDDVLVWGKDKASHDETLREVFKRLAENDMALSVDKCKFGQSQVKYLGYSVTASGIRPLQSKLDSLKKFKEPECQKDVLHFCGAINYFRTSLKGIKLPNGKVKSAAEVLQPLYAIGTDVIPKKKFKEIWENSTNLQVAFREAKQMLGEAVELSHPNANFPLALFSDASDHSIGGSLQMLTPDGGFKPLGFYSAHLTETQRKYSVFKKELLAAFKSLRHFLPDVYGKHLTIYTDHLPLQNVFQAPSDKIPLNDPQVYRQVTEIGRFTRDVRHVKGVDNTFADYLSRIPPDKKGTAYLGEDEEEQEVASTESMKFQIHSLAELQGLQEVCPEIKRIKGGDKPKNAEFKTETIDNMPVFCEVTSENGVRPYVPEVLRRQIMESLHFDHLGIDPTTKRVASQYYWPTLKADVKLFVKTCNTCKKVKPGKKLINMGDFNVPDKRFSHVMVDIVGPLPESYGYKFLLTAICRSTRNFQAIPLREASSSEAAQAFLHHYVAIWGLPTLVTSDNGGSFTSNLWKDMMGKLNIKVQYSALYRPQSIGMLERQHQGLKNSLKAALIDMGEVHQDKWLDFLPFVLLGRRVAYQPDMGASASEMMFGKNVCIPGELLKEPDDIEGIQNFQNLLKKVRHSTDLGTKQPSRHNLPERPLPDIPLDVTHVYTRQHHQQGLQSNFEGPFRVVERTSRSVWKVEVGSYKDGTKRYEYRHLNDLKLAHPKSLAAPVERPKLGRPPTRTSAQVKSSEPTDARSSTSAGSIDKTEFNRFPNPTQDKSKQPVGGAAVGTPASDNHATSILEERLPASESNGGLSTGPPSIPPFARPIRATRNPNPCYVDSISFDVTPWSATKDQIHKLNESISQWKTQK